MSKHEHEHIEPLPGREHLSVGYYTRPLFSLRTKIIGGVVAAALVGTATIAVFTEIGQNLVEKALSVGDDPRNPHTQGGFPNNTPAGTFINPLDSRK